MKKTLQFPILIEAPRNVVWDTMLGPDTYKLWTAEFCEGSFFEGSWHQGERIRFMSPSGDGLISEIAENRLHEYVSIRHLGMIVAGKEDTMSDAVKAWTPAYENYRFNQAPNGTELIVSIDVTPEFEKYMQDAFPKALQRLKGLCEKRPG